MVERNRHRMTKGGCFVNWLKKLPRINLSKINLSKINLSQKDKKTLCIVAAALVLVLTVFLFLYTNGYSGLHNHKNAREGQIKVACVGDSITYGHGVSGWARNNYPATLQKLLGKEYNVRNFGHSGRTASENGDKPYTESKQFKLSLEYDADILVIMLGSNDTKPQNWSGVHDFITEYGAIVDAYLQNNPDLRVIICTPAQAFYPDSKSSGTTNFDIQPEYVSQIRNYLCTYALSHKFEVVDIYDLTANHPEWFEKAFGLFINRFLLS